MTNPDTTPADGSEGVAGDAEAIADLDDEAPEVTGGVACRAGGTTSGTAPSH
jgi:hypothetical protein